MSTPPAHLSGRTLAPGALLAGLVTVGALIALAVALAVGPNGPARLWLDGGGSTVSLQARDVDPSGAALPGSPVGLLVGTPSGGVDGGLALASPGTTVTRSGAVRLRANTRQQRRTAARTPAARRPATPAPAGTPTPSTPVSHSTASAPTAAATPAPAPQPVEKTRERATAPAETEVPKQRAPTDRTAAPAPTAEPTAGPAPAPAPELRSVTGDQTATGGDVPDGVLHRVPHP
jgi:hypothetical protein